MAKQHAAVPLLEGVQSSPEALGLRHSTMIGGIRCDVLLPLHIPEPPDFIYLKPPSDDDQEEPGPGWAPSTGWPGTDGWPEKVRWGIAAGPGTSVTVNAVGVIPVSDPVPWDGRLAVFDHAVGQWKHLLRDWLSAIAGGPTDVLELPVRGETLWADEGYNELVWEHYYDNLQQPQRVSLWQWRHALGHILAGDPPPLARTLLTAAKRGAAAGNPRIAVIDAATAAEVALTAGLADRLAAEASPRAVQALIDRARMLGARLDLARDLGMTIPDRVRPDLVSRRNAVVHQGTAVTDSEAQAAISAAAELVNEYEPLAAHCRQPAGTPR